MSIRSAIKRRLKTCADSTGITVVHQVDEVARTLSGRIAADLNRKKEKVESLADVEFRVFSQFGEDGIIDWLVHWVKPENNTFVEFGVENFTEANCRFLLVNRNWRGLVMDGSEAHMESLRQEVLYWRNDITAKCAFITAENINQLLKEESRLGNELGVLSIDIDGNDYWVLKAIEGITAEILCVEVNPIFGDRYELTVPYAPEFNRFDLHYSGLCFGTSISAVKRLAKEKGYEFVGTCSNGINAFFVRRDLYSRIENRIEKRIAWPALHRDSRDEEGNLSYTPGQARFDLLKDCLVWDCRNDCEVRLGDLEAPFSDWWLKLMG